MFNSDFEKTSFIHIVWLYVRFPAICHEDIEADIVLCSLIAATEKIFFLSVMRLMACFMRLLSMLKRLFCTAYQLCIHIAKA